MRYFPVIAAFDHFLLVVATIAIQHRHQRQVADNGMFVLQIVVQAETLGGEMFADDGHPEIAAILAAIALRDRKAQMAGTCRRGSSPGATALPFVARQPAIVQIGARPFAAMIEEADVVIAALRAA